MIRKNSYFYSFLLIEEISKDTFEISSVIDETLEPFIDKEFNYS